MNGRYLFLLVRSATTVFCAVFNKQKKREREGGGGGKHKLYSFLCPGDWRLQSMKHARQRREKENTEAQTERCDIARLKQRAERRSRHRQTDRQTVIGWVAVSHGGRGLNAAEPLQQQALHVFSYYSPLCLFLPLSISQSVIIAFNCVCEIQIMTRTSVCFVFFLSFVCVCVCFKG